MIEGRRASGVVLEPSGASRRGPPRMPRWPGTAEPTRRDVYRGRVQGGVMAFSVRLAVTDSIWRIKVPARSPARS